MTPNRVPRTAVAAIAMLIATAMAARAEEPIKVGLVAALSGGSAKSGEGITRGLSGGIDEINASGGVFGAKRPVVPRDGEAKPAKGHSAAPEGIAPELGAAHARCIESPR